MILEVYFLLTFVLLINYNPAVCTDTLNERYKDVLDANKTIFWGPGLNPETSHLRARYIFLQLVDKSGNNITESLGQRIITVNIYGIKKDETPCHIWTQVLDCKDGSYIVRYRFYNTCYNVGIVLKVKDKTLSLKKSNFKGPIYEEECNCPVSLQAYIKNNHCNPNDSRIDAALETYPKIDFDNLRGDIIAKYGRLSSSVSLCHYAIKSNNIYRNCYGRSVDFKIFVDAILLSITRKTILPDVEFFINLGDWPLVPKKNKENYPIFSWCGSDDTYDIVIPTYDLAESSIENMGRVMLDMLSVQGKTKLTWENKIPKMFWRGRDSNAKRLDLIDIARKNPDLFNASITRFFFFRDKEKEYGPGQNHISFFDFFDYKYQLNLDGTVAAYRFPYLLAGDSLVFKQDSKYNEFFYNDLNPGEHYVPVKTDLSDIVEKLQWAMKNEDEAHRIRKAARQYARDNLMPQHIFCYHVVMLEEFSKRLKSHVMILPGMEQVSRGPQQCHCDNFRLRDEL